MSDPLEHLARHGYAVIFLAVFVEQVGLPLPAAPILIAAGALAGSGRLNLAGVIGVIFVASLLADSLWYTLGRRHGARVLGFLCRVSIEPDSCVRNTQDGFARHGAWLLAISKFVPGLNTAAPPLAGISGIGISRFLLLDSVGILAFSLIFAGAGYFLSGAVGRVAAFLVGAGGWAFLPFAAAIFAYLGWKYARRRRVFRDLRVARLSAEELKARLDAGEPVMVVDLRHSLVTADEPALPGALRMQPDELEERHLEIPRDRDVVLYCT